MVSSLLGFESYISKNRKRSTVRLYVGLMKTLLNVKPFTKSGLELYFLSLQHKGISNRYINNQCNVLAAWSDYTGKDYRFSKYKEVNHIKGVLSDEEIEAFLSLPCPQPQYLRNKKTISPSYIRWQNMNLYWSIMAFTSMRCGEVAHLRIENIDWGLNLLTIEDSKTNEPRQVPIPPNIKERLKEHALTCTDYLFPSRNGGNCHGNGPVIDSVSWGYDFHKRLAMLGIKRKNLTPYSFRHSAITNFWRQKVPLPTIMKIAGHKKADTTIHYSHMVTEDMQDAIKSLPLVKKTISPMEVLKSIKNYITSLDLDSDQFTYVIENERIEVTIK